MAESKNHSSNSSPGPDNTKFIVKLREHIQVNMNDDQFGVDSLAQSVGMSRSSLHRKLQKAIGISTSQFIREYRLKRALEILRQEGVTASEAAYSVGFSSATYFSTCFHKYYGFTPREAISRNDGAVEMLIKDESTGIKKNDFKKRKRWIAFSAIVLFMSIFYLYDSGGKKNSKTTNPTDEKSIVVLPFKNWTGKKELEYVSDGMTDAIISRLTEINSIDKVIPFTSALSYKETDKTIDEIASELGVSTLLQGNLQISGDQIKINLQMIDGHSNQHLWSEEYVREWKSDEIFTMQTEVVEGIAANMNAVIAKDEWSAIKKIPTYNKMAYSYFLQEEYQKHKSNGTALTNAIELYERAISIDTNFVEAYIGLSEVWLNGGLVWGLFSEQEAWRNSKHFILKALEINPNSPEIKDELYTGSFYFDWGFEEVDDYYKEIIKKPFFDETPGINADYAIKTGRYEEAVKSMDYHILIDPSIGVFFFFKAEALMLMGKIEEAKNVLDAADKLHSDNWFYLRESTKTHYYLGQYEQSKMLLNRLLTQFPDYPPILMWFNMIYAQMEGDSRAVDKHMNELLEKYKNGSSGSPAWFLALYYCTIKDYENAFEWLQKSYDRHEVEMTWLREEPLLAKLRSDPRYKNLYKKVGFTRIGIPIKTSLEN